MERDGGQDPMETSITSDFSPQDDGQVSPILNVGSANAAAVGGVWQQHPVSLLLNAAEEEQETYASQWDAAFRTQASPEL
eukprot:3692323-Rhodomonas_salina.2